LSRLHDHNQTRNTRKDSSGRRISPAQRSLPDNTQHSKQTSLSPAGFEPSIPASERPQTHISDRADNGMTPHEYTLTKFHNFRRCVSLIVRNLMKLMRCNFRRFSFTNSRVCHLSALCRKLNIAILGRPPME